VSLSLYIDIHVHGAVSRELQRRGIDLLRAQDDGGDRMPDEWVLARATELGRVLVTGDSDFLSLAADWASAGKRFVGITFIPAMSMTVGQQIADLELQALAHEPRDLANQVTYLPL
jgi:predicted nuclease of predicted toxin-antitoxin system